MKVLVKGAGDLATGIAFRLYQCGFRVVMTEIDKPTTVRRTVAFSEAVYNNKAEVEGVRACLIKNADEAETKIREGYIPVLVDPLGEISKTYKPHIIVDAIIAKRNTGTAIEHAPLVIGVGPGFYAGRDCHYVVETKRGHDLGRVITKGAAIPNTGIPGEVGGFTAKRLIKASTEGIFKAMVSIGELVEEGDLVAESGGKPIRAEIKGIIRGMLVSGIGVTAGMKCGDIDPRCERSHCFTISDKARSVGGGVLEAIMRTYHIR